MLPFAFLAPVAVSLLVLLDVVDPILAVSDSLDVGPPSIFSLLFYPCVSFSLPDITEDTPNCCDDATLSLIVLSNSSRTTATSSTTSTSQRG